MGLVWRGGLTIFRLSEFINPKWIEIEHDRTKTTETVGKLHQKFFELCLNDADGVVPWAKEGTNYKRGFLKLAELFMVMILRILAIETWDRHTSSGSRSGPAHDCWAIYKFLLMIQANTNTICEHFRSCPNAIPTLLHCLLATPPTVQYVALSPCPTASRKPTPCQDQGDWRQFKLWG